MFLMVVDIVFLVVGAILISKPNKRISSAIYLGKRYCRESGIVSAEVSKIEICKDGTSKCAVTIPDCDGYAELHLSQEIGDKIAEQKLEIEKANAKRKKEDEDTAYEENKVKLVLIAMELPKNELIVKPPIGNQIFLSNSKMAKTQEKEYNVEDASEIQEKIKTILYNRNALLMFGCLLLFVNRWVSLFSAICVIIITLTNKSFADTKDVDLSKSKWVKVEASRIKKEVKKDSEQTASTVPSKADKIIMETEAARKNKFPICENCGTILEDSAWLYCPYCGASHKANNESGETIPIDDLQEEVSLFAEEEYDDSSFGYEDGDVPEDRENNGIGDFDKDFDDMSFDEVAFADEAETEIPEDAVEMETDDGIIDADDLAEVPPEKTDIIEINDYNEI